MSKLGLVIKGMVDTQVVEFLQQTQPALVRLVDDWALAPSIREHSPNTVLIGRVSAAQPEGGDPAEAARAWVEAQLPIYLALPEMDYWEGYNQPRVDSAERVRWFAALEAERVRLLAEQGLKACIGNFSTGTPELDHRWEAFLPAVEVALEQEGILGLQEFSAPFMQFAFGPHQANPEADQQDEGWLTGRYRKIWRQFLQPNGLEIPIAITAAGIDGHVLVNSPWRPAPGIQGGWLAFQGWWREQGLDAAGDPAATYLGQLAWYDDEIRQDDYLMGAALYMVGENAGAFDLAGPLLDQLAEHIQVAPPTPIPLSEEPPPPPAPPDGYNARYLLYTEGIHPSALQATWKYLVAYQVTQGQSFHDAVRLCRDERDVITVINPSAEQIAWLKRHTRANLDIVYAQELKQLTQIMNRRVANNHRFGPPWSAGRDELRLKWPVRLHPHLIIQSFGQDSEGRDHAGWDILAPHGVEVIAAAAGSVAPEDNDPDTLIRLEHRLPNGDIYQTVYTPVEQTQVEGGDNVEVGQLLGAVGQYHVQDESYLHFQLHLLGATRRGYRDPWGRTWPEDLIWPGEKMIDAYSYRSGAEPSPAGELHQYAGPVWEPQVALIGAHRPEPACYPTLKSARVEAVKLLSSSNPRQVDELRRQLDDPFILLQLVASFWEDDAPQAVAPASFARQLEPLMGSFYSRGVRYFEIHHQPNLPQQGLGGTWTGGTEYATWWTAVRDLLAPHFPDARWGFPGLCASAHLEGGQEMWSFLNHAKAAVQAADWVGLNLHWETVEERNDGIINLLGEYRRRWPNKLLFITEFGNTEPDTPFADKEEQYLDFCRIVRKIPGLAAAFLSDIHLWEQDRTPNNLAIKLGNRTF